MQHSDISIREGASCKDIIRIHLAREFRRRQISWRNTYAGDFVNPQWQELTRIDPLFVAYRIFHLGLLVVTIYYFWWTCTKQTVVQKLKHSVYLTNWTHILMTINSLCAILCLIYEYVFGHCGNQLPHVLTQYPLLYRVYWILHSTCLDSVMAVSLGYWLYKPFYKRSVPLSFDLYHFWNAVLTLMDMFIVSIPVRLLHVYTSFILALIYISFTIWYELAGHTDPHGKPYIYPALRWKKNLTLAIVTVVVGLLGLVVIRFALFCLYKLRSWIFLKCYFEYDVYTSDAGPADSIESLRADA